MVALDGFDANNVDPNAFAPIPAGDYVVVIQSSEEKKCGPKAKDPNGMYINFKVAVSEGEHKGRVIFDKVNLKNKNPQAVARARATLSQIARASGVMKPGDTSEFHNKPMLATITVSPPQNGFDASNDIKKYRPLSEAGGGASAPSGAPTGDPANPFGQQQQTAG